MKISLSRVSSFKGSPKIPGDKSISHRGLIFGAIATGTSYVHDILEGEDVKSTARCLRALGVKINQSGNVTTIEGIGASGFKTPTEILDCGNSGTTMRVMMGVLAGRKCEASLSGDDSLVKRPMKRVSDPLRLMGARFELTGENFAPLKVIGSEIKGIDYELKIASAQIKTAILMAALSAKGTTRLSGEIGSRDHTERLLPHFSGKIEVNAREIKLEGGQKLIANTVKVPGDPSTAAFWMGAASLIPGSRIELKNISLNPTRTGLIEVLKRMGAEIECELTSENPEPVGTIRVRHAPLKGVTVHREEIPSLIDELPLLAVLASQAEGISEVRGAEELRVKESDRLEAIAVNLRAMGCTVELFEDGFRIEGKQRLTGAKIQTFHDHRIAMAFSVAALVADDETEIDHAECVAISYPEFYAHLKELTQG